MKIFKIYLLSLTFGVLPLLGIGQYTSNNDYTGQFSDPGSWVSGVAPDPSGVDENTTINGYITCNSDLNISGTVELIINDTLIIYGNLNLANKASLTINTGAICIVYGNVTATNKLNLDFGSHFIVAGDFTASENQTDVTYDNGAAIFILGNVDAGDLPGFNCSNSSDYVPPGSDVDCRYGDIISLEDNENDEGGIYDFFVSGDSLKAVDPVYAELCDLSDVIISVLFSGGTNYTWYDSLGTTVVGNGISVTVDQPGEYYATYDYGGDTITTYRSKVVGSDINAIINSTDASCPGNSDGSISISNPSGGSGNYEYSIDGGNVWQSSGNFTSLDTGYYDVRIRDAISLCEKILDDNFRIEGTDTIQPLISCPSDTTIILDYGECEKTSLTLASPVVSDNCSVDTVINDLTVPLPIGLTTVTWTVSDLSGNIATCEQDVTVYPADTIDIEVVDLGDDCQSGETGSVTTIIWDVNKLSGTDSWSYDYTINDGSVDVESGNNISVTGESIQIIFEVENTTAEDIDLTLNIFNVVDNCGQGEFNLTNNIDSVTLLGVPNTSDIITN